MVDIFKSVFDDEMFADIHYAEDNPAVISTVNVYKLDGHVHADEEKKTYELRTLCNERPAYDLKHNFFVRLNFQWRPDVIKYFKGGLIARLLGRKNPKRIEELLTSYDWAIVSPDVIEEITKLDTCRPADQTLMEDPTDLMPVYTVLGTTIYKIPQDILDSHGCSGTIYLGHRRSITPVIHKTEKLYHFQINDNPDIKKYHLV